MKTVFIILIMTACMAVQAQAIKTDRPDQTESSSTLDRGSLQIESGILFGFEPDERQILAPTTLFRYGLFSWMEIRVLNQFESLRDRETSRSAHGISDLELGMKVQLFRKPDVNLELAFLSHVIFPTGSQAISPGRFGSINKLAIAHSICDRVGIGYNAGYDYFGTGRGDLTWSIALGISVSPMVSVYLEPYGHVVDLRSFEANFDSGIVFLIRENLQLDFSFGTGLDHSMNYIATGLSWNIGPNRNTRNDGSVGGHYIP